MHAPRCSQSTALLPRRTRARGLLESLDYALKPQSAQLPSIKLVLKPYSRGALFRRQPRRTTDAICFHFACGFCGTLRLAHMLYSLARVSRRDRWGWTDHHSGRSSAEPTQLWSKPPGVGRYRMAQARATTQTRKQLVTGGSYQSALGYITARAAKTKHRGEWRGLAIGNTRLWVTS